MRLLPGRPLRLDAVAMAGARHAWVGGNAAIFGTTDGGQTWTRLYSGTATIAALDFLDPEHGWAVGSHALLGTSDGGSTWQPLGEPASGALAAVDFVTPTVGYGVTGGLSGTAVKTADGGRTWTALELPGNVRALCFVSALSGFALGTGGQPPAEVLATSDGGATWHRVLAPAGIYSPAGGQLGCTADGGVWALLSSGQLMFQVAYGLYRSADGGAQWSLVAGGNTAGGQLWKRQPAGLRAPVPGPARLAAISAQTAVLLGNCLACDANGTVSVARSTDGGGTWQAAQVPDLPGIYAGEAAAFADGDHGMLVAAPLRGETEVLATSDGGASWTMVFERRDPAPTEAISFVTAQVGYGLGSPADPAAVLRTSDGGATWTQVGDVPGNGPPPFGQDVLAFTDTEHGWAITAAHALVRTTDGGRTWAPAAVASGPDTVSAVAFADSQYGCIQAVGPEGALWSTADGGATWAVVPAGEARVMRSAAGPSGQRAPLCASVAANPAWVASGAPVGGTTPVGAAGGQSRWLWFNAGQANRLLATHDAGRTWTQYILPSTVREPRSVSFLDARRGWMLTSGDHRVLRTSDGGATWTQVS